MANRVPYVVTGDTTAISDGGTSNSAAFSTVGYQAVSCVVGVVGVDGSWTLDLQSSPNGSSGWATIDGCSASGDFSLVSAAARVFSITDCATKNPYLRTVFTLFGGATDNATIVMHWLPIAERVEGRKHVNSVVV